MIGPATGRRKDVFARTLTLLPHAATSRSLDWPAPSDPHRDSGRMLFAGRIRTTLIEVSEALWNRDADSTRPKHPELFPAAIHAARGRAYGKEVFYVWPTILDVINRPFGPDPLLFQTDDSEPFGSDNGRPFQRVMHFKRDSTSEQIFPETHNKTPLFVSCLNANPYSDITPL